MSLNLWTRLNGIAEANLQTFHAANNLGRELRGRVSQDFGELLEAAKMMANARFYRPDGATFSLRIRMTESRSGPIANTSSMCLDASFDPGGSDFGLDVFLDGPRLHLTGAAGQFCAIGQNPLEQLTEWTPESVSAICNGFVAWVEAHHPVYRTD